MYYVLSNAIHLLSTLRSAYHANVPAVLILYAFSKSIDPIGSRFSTESAASLKYLSNVIYVEPYPSKCWNSFQHSYGGTVGDEPRWRRDDGDEVEHGAPCWSAKEACYIEQTPGSLRDCRGVYGSITLSRSNTICYMLLSISNSKWWMGVRAIPYIDAPKVIVGDAENHVT